MTAHDWTVELVEDDDVPAKSTTWWEISSKSEQISLEVIDWPHSLVEEMAAGRVVEILNTSLQSHQWGALAVMTSLRAHDAEGAAKLGHVTDENAYCPACYAIQVAVRDAVGASDFF